MAEKDLKDLADLKAIFRLSSTKSPSEVTLRSAEWAIITQIDGHKSIGDVAEILALSTDEAINLFNGLFQKGLIEILSVAKEEKKQVPLSFFEKLSEELTKIIGPVAPYLIEDTLWDMEIKKEECDVRKIPEMIEAISEEIPDELKRVQFQKVMLEEMKNLESA
ncbi:MAG TPA: hypothetical protein ENK44_12035 [Caldithrix abyssi]|uniref:DUF8082 domain-containing protein n=1 Tax=Caldithrix abyssi TaxID=187145 RepID=A0A7V4U231_CALAY|nr:hypothetical protein [Caldithrix abyssi]